MSIYVKIIITVKYITCELIMEFIAASLLAKNEILFIVVRHIPT